MITAVDTNVLVDVLIADSTHGPDSRTALKDAARDGRLIICEMVYAELAGQFADAREVSSFLSIAGIDRENSTPEGLYLAGKAWQEYAGQRRSAFTCPKCGRRNRVTCSGCDAMITTKQHLLPDFIIGAHAFVHADRLLTRDRGYYHRYFPDLPILDPSS